jgi:hypothetical protein
MIHTLSYQQYKYERGLTAAEQRAADTMTGPVRFLSSARQRRANALHADPRC